MNLSSIIPKPAWDLMSKSMDRQARAEELRRSSGNIRDITRLTGLAFNFAQQAAALVTRETGEMAFSTVHHHAAYMAFKVHRYEEAFTYAQGVLAGNPPSLIRTEVLDILGKQEMAAVVAAHSRQIAQIAG